MSCSTNHILISSPTPPSQQIISWMVSSILYIEASVSMSRLHSPRLTFVTHSSPLASVSQLHGRAWKIHNKELLINEIAPKYFVQSKYQSFARQLNGWGFKRLHQAGNDFNAYYHECFLRGMPQLAALMKRASPKQGRLIPRVEAEPNFYEMEKFIKFLLWGCVLIIFSILVPWHLARATSFPRHRRLAITTAQTISRLTPAPIRLCPHLRFIILTTLMRWRHPTRRI